MLTENIGQPGFRELLITVHDVDAHRDLLFALVGESRRRDLIRRPTSEAAEARRAEVFDLAGVARDHLPDAVAAALTIPLATEWHHVTFARRRLLARRDASSLRSAGRPDPADRRAHRPRRRADHPRLGGAGVAGPARAARRRGSTAAAASASTCSRPRPPSSATRRRRPAASRIFTDPAGAQSDRPVRFRRRLRRSLASAPGAGRADQPRLRGRVSPVHRAGGGRVSGERMKSRSVMKA